MAIDWQTGDFRVIDSFWCSEREANNHSGCARRLIFEPYRGRAGSTSGNISREQQIMEITHPDMTHQRNRLCKTREPGGRIPHPPRYWHD